MQTKCEITCSDNGKNMTDGFEHYWKCGRPAKFVINKRPGPGTIPVCGIHAKANDRLAERWPKSGIEKARPL